MSHEPNAKGNECHKIDVPFDVCYLAFLPPSDDKIDVTVHKVVLLQLETVRGETLMMDVTKDGEIVGIELVSPGNKPCQAAWAHSKEEVVQ